MNDKEEAKQLTARAEELTGEWYCQSGHHRVKGPGIPYRGRRVCKQCYLRIVAMGKAKQLSDATKSEAK